MSQAGEITCVDKLWMFRTLNKSFILKHICRFVGCATNPGLSYCCKSVRVTDFILIFFGGE